jgi:hypothetical protein
VEPLSLNEANAVDDSLYKPGYVVDDVGKDLIIQLGRAAGLCSTCMNTGSLRSGLRAEVRGIITEVGENNGPHKLAVLSVQLSNNLTSICQALDGLTIKSGSSTASPSLSPRIATGSSTTSPIQPPLYLRSNNGNGFFSWLKDFTDSMLDTLF